MSVWKKLQHVGKKAAKFKINLCLLDISIDANPSANLDNLQVSFFRRSKKCTSLPFPVTADESEKLRHVWAPPQPLELHTNLYRSSNDLGYEEKEWTFQLEEAPKASSGGRNPFQASMKKRVLAISQLNIAKYVGTSQCQSKLKIVMRVTSKNLVNVVLNVELNSCLVRTGDAMDDDMLSIDSMASFSRGGSFSAPQGVTADEFNKSSLKRRGTIGFFNKNRKDKGSISEHPDGDLNFEDITKKLESLGKLSDDLFPEPALSSLPKEEEKKEEESEEEDIYSRGPTGKEILEFFTQVYQKLPKSFIEENSIPKPTSMNSFRNGRIIGAVIYQHFPEKIDMKVLREKEDAADSLKYVTMLCYEEFRLPPLLNNPNVDALSIITYLNELKSFIKSGKDKLGINRFRPNGDPAPAPNGHTNKITQQAQEIKNEYNKEDPDYEKIRQKARSLLKTQSEAKSATPNPPSRFASYFEEVAAEVEQAKTSRKNSYNSRPEEPVKRLNSFNRRNVRDAKRKNISLLNVDGTSRKSSSGKSSENPNPTVPPSETAEHITLRNAPTAPPNRQLSEIQNNGATSSLKKTSSSLGISSYQNSSLKWLKMNNLNLFTSTNQNGLSPTPHQNGKNFRPTETQHSQSMVEINYGTRAQDFIAMDTDQIDYSCVESESSRLADAQVKLDERAQELERILRSCSNTENRTPEQIIKEDEILKEWLQLVNEKSTLIRRSHQLTIIQRQNDLKKKAEILRRELADIINRDESRITEDDKNLEKTLMEKLLKNVNERDAIVQELEIQEEAIAMDLRMTAGSEKINSLLANNEYSQYQDPDKNCVIM